MSTDDVVCPQYLLDAVRDLPPLRTGVVNAVSAVVLESVRDGTREGVIEPVLYGAPDAVRAAADEIGWSLSGLEIVPAKGEEAAAAGAATAAGRGEVAALMKGHVHTDTFMRAVLDKQAGLRTGGRLSHVFYMTAPDLERPLIISDAALNTGPDLKTKQAILSNAVALAGAVGIERPKAALLSASEEPTENIPSSLDAEPLCAWAAEALPGADVQGPLAFDLAVSPEAARIKKVDGPVVGRADILIVPEIVSGNALFKMMVHYMDACAAGIVLGARVPVILTSRADPPPARLASVALAALADKSFRA